MAPNLARKTAAADLSVRRDPIVLRWEDENRLLIVSPRDQDRFALTVNKAISACQLDQVFGLEQFQKQFKQLLIVLRDWAKKRRESIHAAFLAVRDGGLLYVVVRNGPRFDAEFEDDLTELDMKVAHNEGLNMMRLNVLALPKASMEAIATFLSPAHTLQLELSDAN